MKNHNLDTWWGYKHVNGKYQAKRYFDQRDIQEAYESPFVDSVTNSFQAKDRNDALNIVKQKLG